MKSALLIIDVQNIMFIYEEGVYKKVEVLDNIYTLLQEARKMEVPVFFVQHTSLTEGDEFSRGAETWHIHEKIAPLPDEPVIEKNYWDSFQDTKLKEELDKKGITNLIIAGMQTEFCMDTTCRRAFSLGYKNILASDAHTTFDSKVLKAKDIIDHHSSIWHGRFATLMNTSEIIRVINDRDI